MADKQRTIIVTTALPYANGDIHIGHLFEHFISDFWVRFQKMRGNVCLSICADDTHGTPIMVAAQKRGVEPHQLIAESLAAHQQDFKDFHINFDRYSSTNTDSNRQLCNRVYQSMVDGGHIEVREVEQSYCQHDKMFLPDRFVRGTCPSCQATDQYGDQCESCSATYNPLDLKDSRCALCGRPPISRSSQHHFFRLDNFRDFLKSWLNDAVDPEVAKKLHEWLDNRLRDWCISRDAPYFGFEIPDHPEKYFYVWVDAPLGYLSTLQEWCDAQGRDQLWQTEEVEIYHNIGKDIVYFHALFWPAMLKTAGFKLPNRLFVHGMLTADGEKLSKSRGTFIRAKTYLKHLDPEWLRYYLAAKISAKVSDVDFSFNDFQARVNAELVGKITNLASRSAQMIHKKLDGQLGKISPAGQQLIDDAKRCGEVIADYYERREFAKALAEIRTIIDAANRYFTDLKPWQLIDSDRQQAHAVLTDSLNLFRIVCVYLKPILPNYCARVEKLFAEQPFVWETVNYLREDGPLNEFVPLITRVDSKALDQMTEDTKREQLASG